VLFYFNIPQFNDIGIEAIRQGESESPTSLRKWAHKRQYKLAHFLNEGTPKLKPFLLLKSYYCDFEKKEYFYGH